MALGCVGLRVVTLMAQQKPFKCRRAKRADPGFELPWFHNKKRRVRARNKVARRSRQVNRRIAKVKKR